MNSAVKLTIIRFLFQGVLCREFSISLPESVEAVRGLCVLIPCSFDIQKQFDVNLQGDPTGIWLKDGTSKDRNTVFNSKSPKENKIEGEILGNLLMKNCTTVFYNIKPSDGGDYYFRLEAAGSLKNIYKPSVFMSVQDSPISPSITLYKEDQGELEVQNEVLEGTSLSLICSARSPPCLLRPPSFSWNFLPEERRPEQNHNTSFSSSQLKFIASHLHHGLQFTCTATYQLQNHNESAQSSHTLQVLYAPQVSSSSCNSTQDLIMCSCEVDGNPAPKLEWYLAGRPVSPTEVISIWKETQSNTSSRSLISIQSSNGTDTLQCIAFNQLGISSKVFPLRSATQCPAGGSGVDASSVLIGAAVGASGIMMLCAIFLCIRKTQNTPRTGREDMAGIVLNDGAVCQEESMYVNKSVSSESLHYSTLQFKNGAGSDIRGGCDLTTEYATVSHAPQRQTVGGAETSIKEEDKITVEKEEVTYGVKCVKCVRKTQNTPRTGREDMAGIVLNDGAVCQEESMYVNKSVSSESLHYSTLQFKNGAGSDIRGGCDLTTEYATVSHAPQRQTVGGAETSIKEEDKITVEKEEVTYGVKCVKCVRKTQNTPRTGREDMAGIVLNDGAVCQEESMYVNKSVSSESLHYSTLQFKNGAGSDIRGGCDLTTEYATVSHAPQRQTVGGAETSIKEEDKITVEKEEVTYGNITRQPALEKTQLQLVNDDDDDDDDDDDEIKNIKETKETNKEQHRHSKEAEGLYAQVKPNK